MNAHNVDAAVNVTQAMEARHSVRVYRDEPVTEAELGELLRLTGLAPSAFNAQPWRFVVVRDAAVKAELKAAAFGQAQVGAAPVVIVMYSDMQDVIAHVDEIVHPGVPEERKASMAQGFVNGFSGKSAEEVEAWGAGQSYIALGYLLVAAQSLGLGTSPMLGFDPEKVKAVLGLPAHVRVPALIALGHPAETGFSSHRHATERVARVIG